MSDLAADRIFAGGAGSTAAFVAAGDGVVAVELAGDRVGRFRFDRRCGARDVAADGTQVVVATDRDVLLRPVETDADDPWVATGYGPAVAVGIDHGSVVAADEDARIHTWPDADWPDADRPDTAADDSGGADGDVDAEWLVIAEIDAPVRAIDGGLVAAGDGVYRATPDGLDEVGLDDARDVAAAGPFAATGDGLYELGNGWLCAREGGVDVVAAANRERAHAAAGRDVFERHPGDPGDPGDWLPAGAPDRGPVAGIAHGPPDHGSGTAGAVYAVTEEGAVLAYAPESADDVGGGWRTRSLGVADVRAVAIPWG